MTLLEKTFADSGRWSHKNHDEVVKPPSPRKQQVFKITKPSSGTCNQHLKPPRKHWLIMLALCTSLVTSHHLEAKSPQKILVLNSYHQGYKWSNNIIEGIQAELDKTNLEIELLFEHMDTLHYPRKVLFPFLDVLYQEKYSKKRFDVLIVTDNNAFDFILERRHRLFPETPVVFNSINNFDESMIRGQEMITGVTEDIDIPSTIELILRIHPETEQIAVISDYTVAGRLHLYTLREAKAQFANAPKFIEFTNWTVAELKESLHALPKHTVLLVLSASRDRDGFNFSAQEGFKLITDNSTFPSYTLWDSFIGLGPVGGVVTSGRLQGEHAARMAARLLLGEPPEDIQIIHTSPNTPMFDYAQLQRFDITAADLPVNSVIINEPQSFYYKYKPLIWGTLTFFTILTSIIMALAININRREKAETELRKSKERYMRIFNGTEVAIFEENFWDVVIMLRNLRGKGVTDLRQYLQGNPLVVKNLISSIKINDVNDAALRLFGAKSKQELLQNVEKVCSTSAMDHFIEKFCAIWEHSKAFRTECATRALDGRQLSVIVSMPVPGTVDQFTSVPVSIFDITDRKQIELSLHKLSSAVEQSGSAVMITNKDGEIEYVNPRFTEVTGFGAEEAIGQTPLVLRGTDTLTPVHQDLWKTVLAGDDWRGELHDLRKDGTPYWALTSISPIEDDSGRITHLVAVSEDVTELKETQLKMERLAFYDTLTGLENRRLFRERLEQAVKVAQRSDRSVALLYLDLDQFKRVNDTLGHDAGDALLKSVADRLRDCVRQEDTVARIGGDEFTVLLAEVEGSTGASKVAQKIIRSLKQPIKLPTQEITTTTSIGVTLAPTDGIEAEVLLRNADLAMYRAKERGRNNYQFFTEEMNTEVTQRLFLENELRRALDQGQFTLYYQPLVSVKKQEIVSLEALLRWNHPHQGVITPDRFIYSAEETGLIVPVGTWVLWTACQQIQGLRDLGFPLTKVAVNLSARQFREPSLPDTIEQILVETGLENGALELELTESTLMETTEETITILNRLRGLGVSISIDDFGTGYSSLSYLKQFPIDTLKVDRSFVRDIPVDPNDVAITTAVIAMAHKLQLRVVAEGVETTEQYAFLEANQSDIVQGFLCGRPLPYNEVFNLLQTSSDVDDWCQQKPTAH